MAGSSSFVTIHPLCCMSRRGKGGWTAPVMDGWNTPVGGVRHKAGTILYGGQYRHVKVIGSGSTCRAILVHDVENTPYVLKEMPLARLSDKILARKEVQLLSQLSHPNIIRYVGAFEEREAFYIITAYANGGDLYSHLRRLKEPHERMGEALILEYTLQLVLAIHYLHEHQILHRDLKTRNIFLHQSSGPSYILKLGDFGIAKSIASSCDLAYTSIGTPYYLSPEIGQGKPYSYSSDIWSLGCVLYEMITLRHVFEANNIKDLLHQIIKAPHRPTDG